MSTVLKLKIKDKRKVGHRGVYRKKAARQASRKMPCAWDIGDRTMFAGARSRAMKGIAADPGLGGKEKAALAACLDRMNAKERWSCFMRIETIAKIAGCSKATVWRALEKADGVHILTDREKRETGYDRTIITIHPNYRLAKGERMQHTPKLGRMDETLEVAPMRTEPTALEPTVQSYRTASVGTEAEINGLEAGKKEEGDFRDSSVVKGQPSIESPNLAERPRGKAESPRARAYRLAAMLEGNVGRTRVGRAERAGGDIEEIAAEVEACFEDNGDLGADLCRFWQDEW